jgi:hypothetical protein
VNNFQEYSLPNRRLIMVKKIYLPKFAQEMQRYGTYAFEHKGALHEAIDTATFLTDEEKRAARKGIEDIMAAQAVFRKIWLNHAKLTEGL